MKETTKQTWKYFIKKSLDYKFYLFLTVFSIIIATIASYIALPYIYKEIIDLLTSPSQLERSIIFNKALFFLLLVLISYLVLNIFFRVSEFSTNYLQPYTMRDIENDAYEKLQNHSYTFFSNSFSGALVTRVGRFRRAYERIFDRVFWDFLPIIVIICFSSIVLYFQSKTLTLILLVWVFVYVLIMFFLYRWKYKYDVLSAEEDSKVTGALADSLSNVLTIKAFAKSQKEKKRYYDISTSRAKVNKKAQDVGAYINIVQGILMMSAEIIIMYFALKLWYEEIITVGTVILVQAYIAIIVRYIWGFGRIIRDVYEALANAEEMISIMNLKPDVEDVFPPETLKIKKGKIKFENVTFSYEEKEVLKNFSLEIKKGEKVGIVGESGSGKTTLTKLILRFLNIQKGKITIDGQDISKITQEDLRTHISYVSQEPLLFHRTLIENISYAKSYTTIDEIEEVSKKANIEQFISRLPKGYQTMVGERGVKLSGGERQRVAIARAMLKDSPILILDEATSSLDSKSEKWVQEAINNLVKNRTTIVIAHRLSTIQNMDRIIVLDHGKIVEQGTHKSLLRKKGPYSELWKHQAGGFLND